MKHLISSEVTKKRIAQWFLQAKPVKKGTTWTERRQAIEFGGHTYLIQDDQIFACAHCGTLDPQWKSVEVLRYFEENFGIKPHEIEITCSIEGSTEG